MSCILSLLGEDFDIDRFNELCGIDGFEFKIKGEPIGPPATSQRTRKYNRLTLMVSDAGLDEFDRQIHEAVEFLRYNLHKLTIIPSFPGIDYAVLSFGVDSTLGRPNALSQTLRFPYRLVQLCTAIGVEIELAFYPCV